MRYRKDFHFAVRSLEWLVVVLCFFATAIPASAQQLGLTISVSGPPKKIGFEIGPAGKKRGRAVFVPSGDIVRIVNNSGSGVLDSGSEDLGVTVIFRGGIVHQETIAPMDKSDLVVGSPQLPAGARYTVSDPPAVLRIEDAFSVATEEAGFQLFLPSVVETPTLTDYGLLALIIFLGVLGLYHLRSRRKAIPD